MFYSTNDSYMQDLYFYNQQPNNTYNPYMQNNVNGMMQNNAMGVNNMNPNMGNAMPINNINGMFMGPNNNMMPFQNLSSLYPSIYRIINPVVSRVVSSGNNQIINEDSLKNMVDTVFNIVEGQIENEPVQNQRNVQSETQMSSNTSSNNNQTTRTTEANRQTTVSQSTSRNNRNDSLLRDLIRILIIKELLSRNQYQRQYMQSPFYMQQPFNSNM